MTQPGGGEPLRKITLTDNAGVSYDLILEGGDKSIIETFLSPEPQAGGGVGKYGDFEPGFGFIEQRTFERGFGSSELTNDPAMFLAGTDMWSATPNLWMPNLEWKFADNIFADHLNDVDDLEEWAQPANNTWNYATPFTPSANITPTSMMVMVRDWSITSTDGQGVKFKIVADSGGSPDFSTVICDTGDLHPLSKQDSSEFEEWVIRRFVYSTSGALTAGTQYWFALVVSSAAATKPNLIVSATDQNSYHDIQGNPQTGTFGDVWFRLLPAGYDVRNKVKLFQLRHTLFGLKTYESKATPKLYLNGDTGKATAGAATTLTDSNKGLRGTWADDQWNGASLWITDGTGLGQIRTITDSTSAGVLTVDEDWDVNPDTTSVYNIVDTDDWYELTSHGISGNAKDVFVYGLTAYVPCGMATNIRRFTVSYSASPPAMSYADDSTNKADLMGYGNSKIYAVDNDSNGLVKQADPPSSFGTDLTLTDVGGTGQKSNFNKIIQHGSNTFFIKWDSVWYIPEGASKLVSYPIGIGSIPSVDNGKAAASHNEYLFFNWNYSLERLSGLTVDHIDPNRDAGMYENHVGPVSDIISHPAGILFSVDAGYSGWSGVYIFDGLGFHEACTPNSKGKPIRHIYWQSIPDRNPILWMDFGGDIIYQKYPKLQTNPTRDSTMRYQTRFKFITPTIDMGAKGLKKLFKDVTLVGKNINGTITLSYQADADIGSSSWSEIGEATATGDIVSFEDANFYAGIASLGNVREVRLQFEVEQADSDSPPQIKAYTLKGFGRTPTKKQWSLPVSVSETMENLGSGDPDTFMDWIDTKAENAEAILMTAEHPRMHNKNVIIIPRSLRTFWIDYTNESFAGVAFLEVREA